MIRSKLNISFTMKIDTHDIKTAEGNHLFQNGFKFAQGWFSRDDRSASQSKAAKRAARKKLMQRGGKRELSSHSSDN